MTPLPVHVALGISLAESLALAAILALRIRGVAGARLLTLFLAGVAVWICGNELPAWAGLDAVPVAERLIAWGSMTAAVYFHFAVTFGGVRGFRRLVLPVYAVAAASTLAAMVAPPGLFAPWDVFPLFFQPNAMGWAVGLEWAGFGALGHLALLAAWRREAGIKRRQIAAVFAAGAWGLLSMTGYAFAAWGIRAYPWPLLALPLYPLILVYGILRYQVMASNIWARRAVASALLSLAAIGIASLLAGAAAALGNASQPAVPFIAAATALVCLMLAAPSRALAGRFVYTGGEVSAERLDAWRHSLATATSPDELEERAAEAISGFMKTPVTIQTGIAQLQDGHPAIILETVAGVRTPRLSGWDQAPPGRRQAARIFGLALADAAARLEAAERLRLQERADQTQARLAELGALAATVAHDIRNPLNIIAMAAAASAPEIRQEIAEQTARVSRLSRDLLDYAKPWTLERQAFDLHPLLETVAAGFANVAVDAPESLPVEADPARLRQCLVNLLENAVAISGGKPVAILAEETPDSLHVHVCDNGPGIPEDLRDSVFRPFVSRSPAGTGLGLAIVDRIMKAHGGAVAITERADFATCLTLTLPRGAS